MCTFKWAAKAHVKAWDEIEELAATRIQMHGQKTPIIRFVVFVVCFTLVECRSRLRGASEGLFCDDAWRASWRAFASTVRRLVRSETLCSPYTCDIMYSLRYSRL